MQGKEAKQEARVWVDESKGKREIETNDSQYYENKLLMPERIAKVEADVSKMKTDVRDLKADLDEIKSTF